MEIMFDDLTTEAQERLLDEAGVSKSEENKNLSYRPLGCESIRNE
jgi:hypothetical protein